jgi:hypothetical protein
VGGLKGLVVSSVGFQTFVSIRDVQAYADGDQHDEEQGA